MTVMNKIINMMQGIFTSTFSLEEMEVNLQSKNERYKYLSTLRNFVNSFIGQRNAEYLSDVGVQLDESVAAEIKSAYAESIEPVKNKITSDSSTEDDNSLEKESDFFTMLDDLIQLEKGVLDSLDVSESRREYLESLTIDEARKEMKLAENSVIEKKKVLDNTIKELVLEIDCLELAIKHVRFEETGSYYEAPEVDYSMDDEEE